MSKPARRKSSENALRELLNWYPIQAEKAFQVARVHRTTWKRWLSGQAQIPAATLELIKICVRGDICDPAFSGFYVTNGHLIDDCGREYTPEDIRASQFYKALAVRYLGMMETHDFVPKKREIEVKTADLSPPQNLALKG